MIPGVTVVGITKRHDARGWLAEILRAGQDIPAQAGQLYVTAARPGITKGHHYHTRKTEWFCVVQGEGRLELEEMATGHRQAIEMSQARMVRVTIPPGVGHAITNTGTGLLLLLVYVNEVFDPQDPDTLPMQPTAEAGRRS